MQKITRVISLILCAVLMLTLLCACAKQPEEQKETEPMNTQPEIDPNAPLCDGKTLKLLAVTSSFGLNTTELLYAIAKAEGVENVVVGRLYASGCTLKQHVEAAQTGSNYYQYTKFSDDNGGARVVMEGIPLEYGLKDEDWDIIFVQQSAEQAGLIDTYQNYLDTLMEYLQANKTNPNARFVWNMTWAFQHDNTRNVFIGDYQNDQMTMYNMILDCVKEKIVPRTDIAAIIPSGTAVQNARSSYFGDTLTKDTLHLNNLGRAIAGYTVLATLTGKELTEVNLGPVNCYDLPQNLVLSDSDRQVIIESVNNAIKTPWEVTPSSITEKP